MNLKYFIYCPCAKEISIEQYSYFCPFPILVFLSGLISEGIVEFVLGTMLNVFLISIVLPAIVLTEKG